jgi:hypothetical protein
LDSDSFTLPIHFLPYLERTDWSFLPKSFRNVYVQVAHIKLLQEFFAAPRIDPRVLQAFSNPLSQLTCQFYQLPADC